MKTLGQNLPQKNQETLEKLDILFAKKTLQKTFETRTLNNKNKQNLEISQSNSDSNQTTKKNSKANLFDDEFWKKIILPQIEHPHFAKPQVWKSLSVPNVLIQGNHSKIQKWREFDWKSE